MNQTPIINSPQQHEKFDKRIHAESSQLAPDMDIYAQANKKQKTDERKEESVQSQEKIHTTTIFFFFYRMFFFSSYKRYIH